MPQRAKGARLYQRKDTGIWIIRDTGRGDTSTGTRDRGEAERRLASYLVERDSKPCGPAQPEKIGIAEVLSFYASQHAPSVADPARIAFAIDRLLNFWGEQPVSSISRASCKTYAESRVKVHKTDPDTGHVIETSPIAAGTIRKELGTLRAALKYCFDEKLLTDVPKVYLPEKPEPKDRWLTRSEAAKLLWAASRNPRTRHIARFILVALYTGTRKTAILGLRFMKNESGGFVDVERGVLYRKAASQTKTKKKAPPIRITPKLLSHLKRWEARGDRWVISYGGHGVDSVRTAWGTVVHAAELQDVTPHCLRHTAITWACQSGKADMWELSGYFGVSMETMVSVYAHHHPDHQENAVSAVSSK